MANTVNAGLGGDPHHWDTGVAHHLGHQFRHRGEFAGASALRPFGIDYKVPKAPVMGKDPEGQTTSSYKPESAGGGVSSDVLADAWGDTPDSPYLKETARDAREAARTGKTWVEQVGAGRLAPAGLNVAYKTAPWAVGGRSGLGALRGAKAVRVAGRGAGIAKGVQTAGRAARFGRGYGLAVVAGRGLQR
jgi:hypothetical protein